MRVTGGPGCTKLAGGLGAVPALSALREHEQAVGGVVVVRVERPRGLLWFGLDGRGAVGHFRRL